MPKGYPEPGLFQQSLGWVDKDGNGIRYQNIVYSNAYHAHGRVPDAALSGRRTRRRRRPGRSGRRCGSAGWWRGQMKAAARLLAAVASIAAAVIVSAQVSVPPPWAYGYTAAGPDPAAPPCSEDAKPLDCARMQTRRPDDVRLSLPGSEGKFTEFQIHHDYGPADWYPGDHPPMPDIVAHGRERDKIRACALCHYPNGLGKPENGPAGGLPPRTSSSSSTRSERAPAEAPIRGRRTPTR